MAQPVLLCRFTRSLPQIKFGPVYCPITKAPISQLPLGRHLREHRLILIDVVVDDHVSLRRVQPVQSTGILGERSAPGNRHGQKQRIKPCIIEAFTEITAGRDKHAFLAIRDCDGSLSAGTASPSRSMRTSQRSEIGAAVCGRMRPAGGMSAAARAGKRGYGAAWANSTSPLRRSVRRRRRRIPRARSEPRR